MSIEVIIFIAMVGTFMVSTFGFKLPVSVAMLPKKPLHAASVLRWMLGAARAGRANSPDERVRVLG